MRACVVGRGFVALQLLPHIVTSSVALRLLQEYKTLRRIIRTKRPQSETTWSAASSMLTLHPPNLTNMAKALLHGTTYTPDTLVNESIE